MFRGLLPYRKTCGGDDDKDDDDDDDADDDDEVASKPPCTPMFNVVSAGV